eukprot:UN06624
MQQEIIPISSFVKTKVATQVITEEIIEQSDKNVFEWNAQDVITWLHKIGLGRYKDIFLQWNVTGSILINDLTEKLIKNDLKVHNMHYGLLTRELNILKKSVGYSIDNIPFQQRQNPTIPQPIEVPSKKTGSELNLSEKIHRLLFLYPDGLREDMFEFAWIRHFESEKPDSIRMLMMNMCYPYVKIEHENDYRIFKSRPQQTKTTFLDMYGHKDKLKDLKDESKTFK